MTASLKYKFKFLKREKRKSTDLFHHNNLQLLKTIEAVTFRWTCKTILIFTQNEISSLALILHLKNGDNCTGKEEKQKLLDFKLKFQKNSDITGKNSRYFLIVKHINFHVSPCFIT